MNLQKTRYHFILFILFFLLLTMYSDKICKSRTTFSKNEMVLQIAGVTRTNFTQFFSLFHLFPFSFQLLATIEAADTMAYCHMHDLLQPPSGCFGIFLISRMKRSGLMSIQSINGTFGLNSLLLSSGNFFNFIEVHILLNLSKSISVALYYTLTLCTFFYFPRKNSLLLRRNFLQNLQFQPF